MQLVSPLKGLKMLGFNYLLSAIMASACIIDILTPPPKKKRIQMTLHGELKLSKIIQQLCF